MIRLFLAASLASALWPGLASPQGSTVSEAARQLAQEAADARLPFDGELAESAIEDVLRGYGELEDPPERQIIVARVEQELDNRVALALGQGDVGEAAYAMEHFLPVLLPLLGAPAARRWTDRYIQLVEQSPWELRNVLQDAAGTIDLIAALAAAGEADAATQISQAALERIDQELSAAGFELDAEIWSSGFAFAEAVGDDGVASRYRDHAARLLLASPDTVLPHALLNWYRPWPGNCPNTCPPQAWPMRSVSIDIRPANLSPRDWPLPVVGGTSMTPFSHAGPQVGQTALTLIAR